jgi:hypothetical protein
MQKVIENALTGTAKAIKVDFGVTTRTWSKRPDFKIESPNWYTRLIYTDNKIYGYVSDGTRPHVIRAKNASRLAFPANYAAKTAVGVIGSTAGGSSGPTRFAQEVHHPGFPGRKFPQVIGKKWKREWPRNLKRALASEM